jgi:hypothetical protein
MYHVLAAFLAHIQPISAQKIKENTIKCAAAHGDVLYHLRDIRFLKREDRKERREAC